MLIYNINRKKVPIKKSPPFKKMGQFGINFNLKTKEGEMKYGRIYRGRTS